VELDALYHGPDWTLAPLQVFRERVAQELRNDEWVVDGSYGQVADLVWGQADTLVWLDYPLPVVLLRLFRRSVRRAISHEELWNGNREDRFHNFTSRDSIS
jgi:adenylate kinase family enzyme